VVFHGVTRPGRSHASLVRFARALAASGSAVLLPEIREWVELELAPERTVPVTRSCVTFLAREVATTERPGLVGFSFGAPQAVRTAAHPSLQGRVGGVVGFGSYFDLERTFRFQLTGRHEWEGRRWTLDPDPYGRWIIGANYLTEVPDHSDAGDVARALWSLAAEAGDRQVPADDPVLQASVERVREEIAPRRRPLFDLFAPPEGQTPDPGALRELAHDVARAAARVSPELDVRPWLDRVPCPVELVHGRGDRLIPFTETLRLAAAFPPRAPLNVAITGLFAHSGEAPVRAGLRAVREGWRFFRALRRVIRLPGSAPVSPPGSPGRRGATGPPS